MNNNYCNSCGMQVMVSMRICPSCGNRSFGPTQPRPQPKPQPQPIPYPLTGLTSAGNGSRIIAYFIDLLIVMAVGIVSLIPFSLLTSAVAGDAKIWMGGLFWIFWFLIPVFYFTYFHSSKFQATFGKRAVDIVIVTLDGNRLSAAQSFIRALTPLLITILGYLALFVGVGGTALIFRGEGGPTLIGLFAFVGIVVVWLGPFITVFFNTKRQTVIDIVCKTRVVQKAGVIK